MRALLPTGFPQRPDGCVGERPFFLPGRRLGHGLVCPVTEFLEEEVHAAFPVARDGRCVEFGFLHEV